MPRRKGAAQAISDKRQRSIALAIEAARRLPTASVLARDRTEAIRIAQTKSWWPRVLTPEDPIQHGRSFTFAITGET